MAHYMQTMVIDASREQVFEAITDLNKIQEMNPHTKEVEILTEQKTGVGTRTRFVMETEATGRVEWEEEIVEWIPNHIYAFKTVGGEIELRGRRMIEQMPDGRRTRITFSETVVDQPWDEKFSQDIVVMMKSLKSFIEKTN